MVLRAIILAFLATSAGAPPEQTDWPPLSMKEQAAAVGALKAFARDAGQRIKVRLSVRESDRFLLYSDLPEDAAQRSIALLDNTYAKLSELLGIPRTDNIWRGKAVFFVFSKHPDYRRFEKTVHENDPGKTAGICHCLSNGDVQVALYRQADEKEFAHALAHESVHAFLHRLKTPREVPSWIDEGLAEAVACDVSPQEGRAARTLDYAKRGIALNSGLGGMFDADQIESWQYSPAELLTELLMDRDKKSYAKFINAIKVGTAWDEALRLHVHLTRDQLLHEFGASIGIDGVKP